MIRTSHHGSDLLILRQAKLSSPSSSAKAGCRGIRQSGHAELRTRLPPSINSMPRRSNPLRSRKLKICSTDHAHRIRTAKANSSRRAARTPEHRSHVKVMIILGGLQPKRATTAGPAARWRVAGTDVGSSGVSQRSQLAS
jgi:hypothetical protein